MIRFYCQYSYGGFKTLAIEGTAKELLDREVTLKETWDFPAEAYPFFQYGHAKLLYRQLASGELALVVREIPSIHTDSEGRHLSCAILFVGGKDDRPTLDHLAIDIANDLTAFEQFFANLFDHRGGLHIQGDKLREYTLSHAAPMVCTGGKLVPRPLREVDKKGEGVFLFIPLSAVFLTDKLVQGRVCKELKLDINDTYDVTIPYDQMAKAQKKLHITFAPKETDPPAPPTPEPPAPPAPPAQAGADAQEGTQEKDKQIADLTARNTQLQKQVADKEKALCEQFQQLQTLQRQQQDAEDELARQKNRARLLATVLGAACVLLACCLIWACSH